MSDKQLPGAQSGIDKLGREAVRAGEVRAAAADIDGHDAPAELPHRGAERKTGPFGKC
jgi:hypothetical protein